MQKGFLSHIWTRLLQINWEIQQAEKLSLFWFIEKTILDYQYLHSLSELCHDHFSLHPLYHLVSSLDLYSSLLLSSPYSSVIWVDDSSELSRQRSWLISFSGSWVLGSQIGCIDFSTRTSGQRSKKSRLNLQKQQKSSEKSVKLRRSNFQKSVLSPTIIRMHSPMDLDHGMLASSLHTELFDFSQMKSDHRSSLMSSGILRIEILSSWRSRRLFSRFSMRSIITQTSKRSEIVIVDQNLQS